MDIANATDLYARADYAGALNAALSAAQAGDAGTALLVAAKCLVALRNFDGLGKVIGVAQQHGAALERVFFRILHDCLGDGLYEPLVDLAGVIPDSGILHPIALYHASCAWMMLGDDATASDGFDRFRLAMPRFLGVLPVGTDDDFNVMFRQGTLVLPLVKTAERIADGAHLPSAQGEIEIVRPQDEGPTGPIVLCCADALYVEHFLPRWVAPLVGLGHSLHVHLIDPGRESLALIDQVIAEHDLGGRLSVSVSSDRHHTATSYACARFETVPALLEAFHRPLVALDIDVAAMPALATLAALPFADFGCFETGRCEPASVHQASIMTFANSAESVAFVRDLSRYCRPKLHQPVRVNWMLDQAALFSVLRLYRATKPGFRYWPLDRLTGRPMSDFVVGLASDAEKHALKVRSAGLGAGAHSSGTVDFTWEP